MDIWLALPIAVVSSLAVVIGMGVVILSGDEKRRILEEAKEADAAAGARADADEQMQQLRDKGLV